MPSKGTAQALAKRPARRLARLARAFCSVTTMGMRHSTAPTVHGTEA